MRITGPGSFFFDATRRTSKAWVLPMLLGLAAAIISDNNIAVLRKDRPQQFQPAMGTPGGSAAAASFRAAQEVGLKPDAAVGPSGLPALSGGGTAPEPAVRARLVESYGRLPLSFEANQGQTDSQVTFLSRGRGYSLFLTPTEAVLALRKPSAVSDQLGSADLVSGSAALPRFFNLPASELQNNSALQSQQISQLRTAELQSNSALQEPSRTANRESLAPALLRLRLVGANPAPKVTGLEQLPGKSNYFLGNDPKKWRTNVPNYAKVKYEGVYPGIDLVYYGNQGQLEYDFVVAPGADPKAIRLAVVGEGLYGPPDQREHHKGAPLRIAANGDLVITTDAGEVRLHKPVVYQPVETARWAVSKGETLQRSVSTSRNGGVSPPLQGNLKWQIPNRKYLDGRYVLKVGEGSALPNFKNTGAPRAPLPNPESRTPNPAYVVGFEIAAYDPAKPLIIDPVLSYSTCFGGYSSTEEGLGIAVDSSGNAYVTGYTQSSDFPTMNPFQATCAYCVSYASDAFVAKFNPSMSGPASLVYSTYLGGTGGNRGDVANAIAVDSSGNAYVTGQTYSTDFPTTTGAFKTNVQWAPVTFVTKLDTTGSALVYSTFLGGNRGTGIAVDSSGNAHVTGWTVIADFPTVNPVQASHAGGTDAFVTKLNALGSALVYSTYLGGSDTDMGASIAVDPLGQAYVIGTTSSSNFPTVSSLQSTRAGNEDAFVVKYNATGSALVYSTYLGGSDTDMGASIAADSSGNAYVTGYTYSTNFPTTQSAFQANNAGIVDAFVAKLNTAGSALAFSTYLGGKGGDRAYGIAVDTSSNVHITGETSSTDFPMAAPIQATCRACIAGVDDVFVTKLSASGSPLLFSTYLGGSTNQQGNGIAVDASGNVYVVGTTSSSDFPTTSSSFQPGSTDGNAFFTRISTGPAVALSPGSLTFASQALGTTSAPQTVTLTNRGDSTLILTSITIQPNLTTTGPTDFAQTNNCGSSLVPVASCTITVTFTPTMASTRTAVLIVTDNAEGSPHFVNLTGAGGGAPALFFSTTSLSFGNQLVGMTSKAQSVTLSNIGDVALNIASVTTTGDFAQSNNCGTSLAPGTSCTISVTFTPTAMGTSVGGLAVTDNAPGSPHTVPLVGTGVAPVVSLSPASLTFGNQNVGTTSAAQTIKLTNTGTAPLTISSIGISPEFSESNTCGSYIAPEGGCTFSISFAPTTPGPKTGTLTIKDNAPGSPHVVNLAGTGAAPVVSLSATSLSFGEQRLGTTSAAQTLTLTNTGNAPLSITSVATSGDFAQTNPCGSSVAVNANCTFSVTFTPTAPGSRTGTLTVTDNAAGSPRTVSLSGTGVGPAVTLAPTSLDFGKQMVSSTSAAKSVTLTNSGNASLTITSMAVTGDFAQTNTCGAGLAAAGSCTISVTFAPKEAGNREGRLTITNNAVGSPHSVGLTGAGTDFAISAASDSSTTVTVVAGQTATYKLTFAPSSGFTGNVLLSCSGAPTAATCTVSPSLLTLDGVNAAAATVSVTTTARSMAAPRPQLRPPTGGRHRGLPLLFWLAASAMLASLILMGRRRTWLRAVAPLGTVIVLILLWTACGGGVARPAGTPAGTYSLTVTATSGSLSRAMTLTLTVN